jgi:hypothetical protein
VGYRSMVGCPAALQLSQLGVPMGLPQPPECMWFVVTAVYAGVHRVNCSLIVACMVRPGLCCPESCAGSEALQACVRSLA